MELKRFGDEHLRGFQHQRAKTGLPLLRSGRALCISLLGGEGEGDSLEEGFAGEKNLYTNIMGGVLFGMSA